jgi:N-acetylated-alpha-linked acidic dipeptidase
LTIFYRVEELATASKTVLHLAPLRAAIKSLQFASLELDAEKLEAERVLKRLIRKWQKGLQFQYERKQGYFRRFMRRLRGFFTAETSEPPTQMDERFGKDGVDAWVHRNDDEVHVEDANWPHLPLPHRPKHPHWPHWPHKPRRPPRKLIEAALAVRKINQKLVSFERGFIHEDGIKDREWYRHLGVAPGKWLGMFSMSLWDLETNRLVTGYGATTLPGLTEAITIENNITLANSEAARLTEAVEKIAAALRA